MAVVKVNVDGVDKHSRTNMDDFWKDVAKLKKSGDAVLLPDGASRQSMQLGVSAIRRAFGIPIHERTIGGKSYAVHL